MPFKIRCLVLSFFAALCVMAFCTVSVLAKTTWAAHGQRYELSFEKTQQMAETGDPDAEYALGYMYYYGVGSVQDIETAISWIHKAAAQGQPQAVKAMQLLTASEHKKQAQVTMRHVTGPLDKVQKAAPQPPKRKPGTVTVTPDEKSLLVMSGHRFTIQLLGTPDRSHALRLIKQNDLGDSALIYQTSRNDASKADWYVVVYGDYKSPLEAKLALLELPKSVLQLKPWVKTLSQVQAEIRKRYPS